MTTVVSCDNSTKTYFQSGKLFEKFEADKDGKKQGKYTRYFESGKIAEEATFSNNEYDGLRKIYYENGQVESTATYKLGKIVGENKVYYDSGELKVSSHYSDSKLEGDFVKFYKNGDTIEIVHFENDLENGPFREYYENGKIKAKGQYLGGDKEFGLLELYDSLGVIERKMQCDSLGICRTIWPADKVVDQPKINLSN